MAARLKKKNKPRADYEPRSAHGRAVNKPRVDYEPRSAHGRAVNKFDLYESEIAGRTHFNMNGFV